MRYEIKNKLVVASMLINAPYDSIQDALDDIDNGYAHNCSKCVMDECSTQDALQRDNIKRAIQGKLIGE